MFKVAVELYYQQLYFDVFLNAENVVIGLRNILFKLAKKNTKISIRISANWMIDKNRFDQFWQDNDDLLYNYIMGNYLIDN